MPYIHFDEAKRAAIIDLERIVVQYQVDPTLRALVIIDLFGKLRVCLWGAPAPYEAVQARINGDLGRDCGSWWTGETIAGASGGEAGNALWERAWNEASPHLGATQLRILDRHRTRTAWFVEPTEPLWRAPEEGPPIVLFFSFKGGLGRTTALASFAIQQSQRGKRVCVVDFDLDAPGVGRLLAADEKGATAQWGVVDYSLERPQSGVPLEDYFHRCDRVAGQGQILVFPAGIVSDEYADKLARIDLEEAPGGSGSPYLLLLEDIRNELDPDWILVDARAGVSDIAGQLLAGLAHLHVVLSTTSAQSWEGTRMVLNRLGKQRVLADRPQSEILIVHAMVPRASEAGRLSMETFAERSVQEFTELYYAGDIADEDEDRFWTVRDLETGDAPHIAVPLLYDEGLAYFQDISDVSERLCEKEYRELAERIVGRFREEPEA